jgi:hypothetical protein
MRFEIWGTGFYRGGDVECGAKLGSVFHRGRPAFTAII